ncbi:adenylyltransferase/cytidyltransferase family protein [candidate division WOR-3 bacterium]|nr:adenylyltransferase/cytidyltransferase family protein [candidate division WOR-3 bacterium]
MDKKFFYFGPDNEKIKKSIVELSPKGKIVFTNGCFDILHKGHADIFQFCKTLGESLIVGVNSDESVKRLKGEKRPILGENERASLLSAIKYIDCVIVFSQDTPFELVKFIEPDLIVKGGDYGADQVVGSDIVSETRIFPLVEGAGTSIIIEKIVERYCGKENR